MRRAEGHTAPSTRLRANRLGSRDTGAGAENLETVGIRLRSAAIRRLSAASVPRDRIAMSGCIGGRQPADTA